MTIQDNNKKLNYVIYPTFTEVDILFVLSFVRNDERDHGDSFKSYYLPNIDIIDFNVLIDGKSFVDLPVKNEEEACEKIIEMNRNND